MTTLERLREGERLDMAEVRHLARHGDLGGLSAGVAAVVLERLDSWELLGENPSIGMREAAQFVGQIVCFFNLGRDLEAARREGAFALFQRWAIDADGAHVDLARLVRTTTFPDERFVMALWGGLSRAVLGGASMFNFEIGYTLVEWGEWIGGVLSASEIRRASAGMWGRVVRYSGGHSDGADIIRATAVVEPEGLVDAIRWGALDVMPHGERKRLWARAMALASESDRVRMYRQIPKGELDAVGGG